MTDYLVFLCILISLVMVGGLGGYYWATKTTKPVQPAGAAKVTPKTIEEVLANQVYGGKSFTQSSMVYYPDS